MKYLNCFYYDPIQPLINPGNNPAIVYFARRDLLGQKVENISCLSALPEPQRIIRGQKDNGSWKYPGKVKTINSPENYDQLETFRQLGVLIEKYGFTNKHPVIQKAASYLFSCQKEEGDFRGIYGTQYAITYSAAITELLIKAGYGSDNRIKKSLKWMLSIRQDDGGWAIPLRTRKLRYADAVNSEELIQPDRIKPFSHLVTGMVLRAFAESEEYRDHPAVKQAGYLLCSRFFKSDKYPDRSTPDYWIRFSYPYWFTDLLTALDSLNKLGFTAKQENIRIAIDWFRKHQSIEGTWRNLKMLRRGGGDKEQPLWLTLQISRVCNRYNREDT